MERRWEGGPTETGAGGSSHLQVEAAGGPRAPPGTALSFPAGNKRLCVSSLRRAGLQIEIIKSLWFSNQCEVINVLAWSVINPGAAAQAQDNGIFFFFWFGRLFFSFSQESDSAGRITQIITFNVSAWIIELDSSCSV